MGLNIKNNNLVIKNTSWLTLSAGYKGDKGDTGDRGPAGNGIPAGGTAGQTIKKIDGTNYNTKWELPVNPKMTVTSQKFITTAANQSTYTFTGYSNTGYQSIYVNGFKIPDTQYTISSTGVFTLANPPELANQEVEIRQLKP